MTHSTRRLNLLALITLVLLISSVPAYALIVAPAKAVNEKSKPACQRSDASSNPFCKGYTTSGSGKAGWKVAVGKINLGKPTPPTNSIGKTNVLSGLSGLVTPKDEKPLTLSQKADLKMAVKKAPAKYMSLVDFVKSNDAANKGLRR
ncbi:MAG: hypothetical protein AABX47_00295 [Nanoarchaeota archaeon]